MTTQSAHLAELADAAGLILAEARGDNEAARIMLGNLLDARDLYGTIALARALISAAGLAVAHTDKHPHEPAATYLARLVRHARTTP